MKNILIICLFTFFQICLQFKVDAQEVKKITIDFATKSFIHDKPIKDLTVGDWVQLIMVNIPDSTEIGGMITFGNKNIELKENFASFLSFGKSNSYVKSSENSAEKSEVENQSREKIEQIKKTTSTVSENELENLKNEVKTDKFDTKLSDNFIQEKLKKLYGDSSSRKPKLNEDNMIELLEVGNAQNYLNKRKLVNDTAVLKALADIKWQKYLIKILQGNLVNMLKKKDELIFYLSKEIDDMHSKTEKPKKTLTKYFPLVRVDNYDYCEIGLEISDMRNRNKDVITLPFKNKRGFKMDFSTGFVFNGLYNENYQIVKIDEDNVKIQPISRTNKIPFNTGISLMAHAYRRSGKFINMAGTTGLSYNLNNQNLNYILGGSILFGDDQRFIISGGMTAGRVKELVGYFKPNVLIPNDQLNINSAVPYNDKLKATWFIGITYNLGINGKTKSIRF